MPSETRRLFEMAPATLYAPEMRGVDALYRFDVEDGDQWTIRVADGNVALGAARPDDEEPTCIITASDADMAVVLRGEQNMLTALLQGRIGIVGDLALAQRLAGILFVFGAERPHVGEEGSPTP